MAKIYLRIENAKKEFNYILNPDEIPVYENLREYKNFYHKYDNDMYSDWNRINENGESFRGKYFDDCENACSLTRIYNCELLYERVIKEDILPNCMFMMVSALCENRTESVNALVDLYNHIYQKIIEPNKDFIMDL
jgi:hypothetical protein